SWARVSPVGWPITRRSSWEHVVVSDVNVVVVMYRAAAAPVRVPIAAPVIVAVVDQRPKQNPGSERQDPRQEQITPGVTRWRRYWRSVSTGWIVLRYINRIRLGRLDDDRLLYRGLSATLSGSRNRLDLNCLLFSRFQRSRVHCHVAQDLDRIHHVGRLIVVSLTQRRSPRQAVVHRMKHGRELSQRLDAGIPRLLIHLRSQLIAGQVEVLLEPSIGFHHLSWIGRSGQNL